MHILYFSWVRERMAKAEETLPLTEDTASIQQLIQHLKSRDASGAHAFADSTLIRVAVNQAFVSGDHALNEGDEVAFFPPVTGG